MSFNGYNAGNYNNAAIYGQQPYNSYYIQSPYGSPQQRLQNLEQQYPQYGQAISAQPTYSQNQPVQVQPQAQGNQSQSPIMAVKTEQQARDYPLDLSGTPQLFVLEDDSKIFAKRFNVSNGLAEFEIYKKVIQGESTPIAPQEVDSTFLLGVTSDFSNKLKVLYTEIQELRKEVKHINGNQFNGNSATSSESKPANESDNGSNSGNGKRRAKPTDDN